MKFKVDIEVTTTIRVVEVAKRTVVIEDETGRRTRLRADDKLELKLTQKVNKD